MRDAASESFRACVLAVSLAILAADANGGDTARPEEAIVAGLCEAEPGGPAWLDRMQAGLYRATCLSAARFDGLFGGARLEDEYQATHGSFSAGASWSERERTHAALRFRAHVQLPRLSGRFAAFIGRDDPDEHVTELRNDLPRQFGLEEDGAVLLGLGYRQPAPGGGYFDAGIGASLGSHGGPYLKGRYHLVLPLLERNVLRLGETLFWRDGDGVGTTSRIDLERLIAEDFLARWTGAVTLAQHTEGVRWFSSATLYQNLGQGRAFAYQVGVSGETDHEVPVLDYGLRVIFRRRILREWLFLDLRSSITWPRETLLEPRVRNIGVGAGLQMLFGAPARHQSADLGQSPRASAASISDSAESQSSTSCPGSKPRCAERK